MINVCAMTKEGQERYRCWLFDGKFEVVEVDKADKVTVVDNRDYRDYEHFWGVYGKFNPEIGFKPEKDWVGIPKLTYKILKNIYISFKEGEDEIINFAGGMTGASSDQLEVIKQNKCGGFWKNTKEDGTITYESGPSFNSVVKGSAGEVTRRAVLLAQECEEEKVIVVHHDNHAKESGVCNLELSPKIGDREIAAIAQHFVDAGIGTATVYLYENRFKFVVSSKDDIHIVKSATKKLPRDFEPKLTFTPAVTKYIEKFEYKSIINAKRIKSSDSVISEVFIMGVGPCKGIKKEIKPIDENISEVFIMGIGPKNGIKKSNNSVTNEISFKGVAAHKTTDVLDDEPLNGVFAVPIPLIGMDKATWRGVLDILCLCDNYPRDIFKSLITGWIARKGTVTTSGNNIIALHARSASNKTLAALIRYASAGPMVTVGWDSLRRLWGIQEQDETKFKRTVPRPKRFKITESSAHLPVDDSFTETMAEQLLDSLDVLDEALKRATPPSKQPLPDLEQHWELKIEVGGATQRGIHALLESCTPEIQKIYCLLIQGWHEAGQKIYTKTLDRVALRLTVNSHTFNLCALYGQQKAKSPRIEFYYPLSYYFENYDEARQRYEQAVARIPIFSPHNSGARIVMDDTFTVKSAKNLLKILCRLAEDTNEKGTLST